MITIRNLTKRTVVLNLPHATACSPTECTCGKQKVGVQDHNPVTGDRVVRAVHQRIPASVTMFPKGTMDGDWPIDRAYNLIDHVRRVPEVVNAVAAGDLEIIVQKDEVRRPTKAKPEETKAEEPTTAPAPSPETKDAAPAASATTKPSAPATTTKLKTEEK